MTTRQNKPYFVEIFVGIFVMALGIYVYIEALGFPILPGNDYGASLFPRILGAMMFIGGIIVSLSAIKGMLSNYSLAEISSKIKQSKLNIWPYFPIALVILYIYAADYMGSMITIFFMLMIMFLSLGVGIIRSCIVAIVTSVVVWSTFAYMLKVPLPLGIMLG